MSEPKIKLDGVEYPLVPIDDLTMREQREFERIAEAGVDKLETLNRNWRAGLVVAWMAVSIKRSKPMTPIDQIVDRLDQLKAADLREAWSAVAGPSPPDEQPPSSGENEESETKNEPASSAPLEPGPENGSPNGSGTLPSEPAAASVLPISAD